MRHSPRVLLAVACLAVAATACRKTAGDHVKRAERYAAEKKYGNAIVEYRAALQQDAKLGDARLKLADLYAEMGDLPNAYAEYIRAADTMPDNRDAQLKAGAMLLLANRFADAKARADAVLRTAPRDSAALMLLGNSLAGLKDVNGAISRITEAIEAEPDNALAYSNLGALQFSRGDQRLAEASFKKAVSAGRHSAVARVALANFYLSQGRDADAEATLKEALQLDPQNLQVNANLVEMYIRTGRPAEAETPLRTVTQVLQTPDAKFALAEYYLRTKRSEKAVPILKELAAAADTYTLATVRLAAVAYKEGRTADAHRDVDIVLKRDSSNRAALLLKGQLLAMEHDFDGALQFLQRAASADPVRSAEADLVSARIHVARGQLDDADDAYKRVLARDPRSVPGQIGLSIVSGARGDMHKALDLARGAVAADPTNAEAHLMVARALVGIGDTEGADREIRLLRDRSPASPVLEAEFGRLLLIKKEPVAARAAFLKALELAPNSAENLAAVVGMDLASADSSAAAARIDERLKRNPSDKQTWFIAAHMYFSMRDYDRAEHALRKTIELDPSNLGAYAMLGAVYGIQSKLEDARHQFEGWALRDPRSIAAHTMVALIFEQQNRDADARRVYERVLEIDPHAAIAANNLAYQYAQTGGNLDVALQLAQTANSQAPDEPQFNDTLGWVYYKQNMADHAAEFIQRAVNKDPKNPVFRYHLGMALAMQGEDVRAIAELKLALAIKPTFEGADEARKTLSELVIP